MIETNVLQRLVRDIYIGTNILRAVMELLFKSIEPWSCQIFAYRKGFQRDIAWTGFI